MEQLVGAMVRAGYGGATQAPCPSPRGKSITTARLLFNKYTKHTAGLMDQQSFNTFTRDLSAGLSSTQCEVALKLLDTRGGGLTVDDFCRWWANDNCFACFNALLGDELDRCCYSSVCVSPSR